MFELFKEVGLGLIMLLPLVNPLATIVLFLSLSEGMSVAERNKQALLTSVCVFTTMVITFYAGTLIMNVFGISMSGLRIAGGVIVFFIGFHMLFPKEIDSDLDYFKFDIQKNHKKTTTSIAFVPLTMPSTVGPGAISMIISWVSTFNKTLYFSYLVVLFAPILVFLSISFLVWIGLRGSCVIMNLIGATGIKAISRIMGFILVCMGVQFIINGILEIITNCHL
ncbi:MarC family NAAT transporter [Sodalis sp. CWE]|uniref:MarC family NAAT transporter n=1 Tax=Sodalis sp. CWE TaxID=2803816 RepID=UPI001C7E1C77|nr:MarC family NAAT transporter [Sodalis sp. CWE]MBX4181062.1 MarC family NAAT transporter [Sodalis sp. CWE]